MVPAIFPVYFNLFFLKIKKSRVKFNKMKKKIMDQIRGENILSLEAGGNKFVYIALSPSSLRKFWNGVPAFQTRISLIRFMRIILTLLSVDRQLNFFSLSWRCAFMFESGSNICKRTISCWHCKHAPIKQCSKMLRYTGLVFCTYIFLF